MDKQSKILAVVGATGAVGGEILKILVERRFPIRRIVLLASRRSAGAKIRFSGAYYPGGYHPVTELSNGSFKGVDIAIFSAGTDTSREFGPIAQKAGCIVIDNSSAFRMDPDVPLVIPEINAKALKGHRGIIANPNCTTAIALMALWPLHREYGLERVVASSYQAVSGAGARAIAELERQIGDPDAVPEVFPHRIAGNVIPQVDSFLANGYTKEEMKLQYEGGKIMYLPSFRASVTCVRVPVERSHSIAISAQFVRTPSPERAREVLAAAPGIRVVDTPEDHEYPMPRDASGRDECLVGRIRTDIALDNALSFFVVGDQLRKGAALNAVQIAERLL